MWKKVSKKESRFLIYCTVLRVCHYSAWHVSCQEPYNTDVVQKAVAVSITVAVNIGKSGCRSAGLVHLQMTVTDSVTAMT